mgnify:CR=1 FL=1
MSTHVWFCRGCNRKGDTEGQQESDLIFARIEHDICSPDCEDLIRIATKEETSSDPEISHYKIWDED